MKQIQSVFNYINLYIKSFRFVCRSSGKLTAALLLLVPVQALLPTVTLYLTDRIISQIQSGDPDLLALLLAVWGTAFIAGNLASPMVTFVQGQLTTGLRTGSISVSWSSRSGSRRSITMRTASFATRSAC